MATLNLLIADDSEDFSEELQAELQNDYHIFSCKNGKEALALSQLHNPDVLVLDLMIPGLDGISLLHALIECEIHPMVLASSRIYSDYILDEAAAMNVGYLLKKPCDAKAAAARVRDLTRRLQPGKEIVRDAKVYVSGVLKLLGFTVSTESFSEIREAVILKAKNPHISITKELYPSVGHLCGHTGAQVERSIRTALENAWKKRDDEIWSQFFPIDSTGSIAKMPNSVFLEYLAEDLRQKMP